MKRLTQRQQEVLDFIQQWIQDKQYPPSVREIATRFGLRSASGVHKHIKALVRKNFIAKDAFLSRSLRVLGSGGPVVTATAGAALVVRVPVRGILAAGGSVIGLPPATPPLFLAAQSLADARGAFALQIGGDHLAPEGLFDGDCAVVMPQAPAGDGQIVLAVLRGVETVIRRYRRTSHGGVTLAALHGSAPPAVLGEGDVKLLGVVSGVWRRYP